MDYNDLVFSFLDHSNQQPFCGCTSTKEVSGTERFDWGHLIRCWTFFGLDSKVKDAENYFQQQIQFKTQNSPNQALTVARTATNAYVSGYLTRKKSFPLLLVLSL